MNNAGPVTARMASNIWNILQALGLHSDCSRQATFSMRPLEKTAISWNVLRTLGLYSYGLIEQPLHSGAWDCMEGKQYSEHMLYSQGLYDNWTHHAVCAIRSMELQDETDKPNHYTVVGPAACSTILQALRTWVLRLTARMASIIVEYTAASGTV